jgi:putative solute:sodium symporter small subunit
MRPPTGFSAKPNDCSVARLGPIRCALLLAWASASFGSCYFARDLQALLGPELPVYSLAAQGLLIVFIVVVVVNAIVFNRGATHEADDGG